MSKIRLGLLVVGVSVLVVHCSSEHDRGISRLIIYKTFTDEAGAAGQPPNPVGGVFNSQGGQLGASGGGGIAVEAGGGGAPTGTGGQPSGGGGSGGGQTSGGGGQGTGGGGNVSDACVAACKQTYCDTQRAACTNATGTAAAGPAKDQAKKDLCGAMIQCAETTKCYEGSNAAGENCYCGTTDQTGCISGLADGACKAQAENAAETTAGISVGQRWVNPGYAIGLSGIFIRCTLVAPAACATRCASSGSGGSSETGGGSTSGSGGSGVGGTGGVAATGGSVSGGSGGDATGGATSTGGSDAGGGAVGSGGIGSGGSNGSGGSGGSNGSGGSGGNGGGTPPRTCVGPTSCYADLNTNGRSDCSESWVKNAQFLSNIDGWSPGFLTEGAWSATGPNSCSGALASTVKMGLTEGGVSQCVHAAAGETYRVRAQYFVDALLTTTSASLTVAAYSNADCSTVWSAIGNWNVSANIRGTWTEIATGSVLTPVNTQSLRIALNAARTSASEPDATVLWDNVLLLQP